MNPKITIILLLIAIAVQAVFGGLQNTVSICLGGGHQHAVEAVTEHCEFECSHHNGWITPTTDEEHLRNCDCTDLEFGLIVLLTTPRAQDNFMFYAPASLCFESFADQAHSQTWRGPPQFEDDFGMMRHIDLIRSTRLRV